MSAELVLHNTPEVYHRNVPAAKQCNSSYGKIGLLTFYIHKIYWHNEIMTATRHTKPEVQISLSVNSSDYLFQKAEDEATLIIHQ